MQFVYIESNYSIILKCYFLLDETILKIGLSSHTIYANAYFWRVHRWNTNLDFETKVIMRMRNPNPDLRSYLNNDPNKMSMMFSKVKLFSSIVLTI